MIEINQDTVGKTEKKPRNNLYAKGKRKISIAAKLRNYFITGIVVLVPIGITLYLTRFFVRVSSKLIPAENP